MYVQPGLFCCYVFTMASLQLKNQLGSEVAAVDITASGELLPHVHIATQHHTSFAVLPKNA